MKRFSAQYIITNSGPLLRRAVITTEDDGTIVRIDETGGDIKEEHSVEFYNGVIVPGFVNCHCHLELSHMRGLISRNTGLGDFIGQVRESRSVEQDDIISMASSADIYLYSEGIVLCADICNTPDTFKLKQESRINYINLLEVFGIDPEKAGKRLDEILSIAGKAKIFGLQFTLVPHSAYSMSLTLLRALKKESLHNKVTSVHFMETKGEELFLNDHSGPLMLSYQHSGLLPSRLEMADNHKTMILDEITGSGNLILVHNTFASREIVKSLKRRKNLFWCLCPNSNLYIENKLPDLKMFIEEQCAIVVGTDSLASNSKLSILNELKTIQDNLPGISLEELISWATINGARALNEESRFGSIEVGKKPGLLILQNIDLVNKKLLPESYVTRLI